MQISKTHPKNIQIPGNMWNIVFLRVSRFNQRCNSFLPSFLFSFLLPPLFLGEKLMATPAQSGHARNITCQKECHIGYQKRCQNTCQIECQKECQIEWCQNICHRECQIRMSEYMSDRMSECMSDRMSVGGDYSKKVCFFLEGGCSIHITYIYIYIYIFIHIYIHRFIHI